MTSNQLLKIENCDFEYSVNKNFELTKAYFLFSVLDYPLLTKIGNAFLLLVLKLFKIKKKNT